MITMNGIVTIARKTKTRWIIAPTLLLAICAGGWYYWNNRPISTATLNSLHIVRTSSGGLSGSGDGGNITIDKDMFKRKAFGSYRATTKQLSRQQLTEIVRRIDHTDFTVQSRPNICADSFTTTLTITLEQQSRRITFNDCDQMSASLRELDDYLRLLVPDEKV